MGLFSEETPEERDYKRLIKTIRNSGLNYEIVNYLVSFVSDIRDKKRNNDFFDFEFLEGIMLEITNSNFNDYDEFMELFKEVLKTISFFLPEGAKTPDYEAIKTMFIHNFGGNEGLLAKDVFDQKFYSLFDSRLDYLYIMNLIKDDEELVNNYHYIVNYALEVAPYTINQSVLKNEILSYINGLKNELGSIEEYSNRRLVEAKKRMGVYPIDEKTLATISAEAEKAQGLIVKLSNMQKKVDDYQDRVNSMTKAGVKEINDTLKRGKGDIGTYSDNAISEMKKAIEETRVELVSKLDEYLLSLEQALKHSSDEVFKQLLLNAEEKINGIKVMAEGLSSTTTSELLRIQKATQDSVAKLKSYVETEPQLQEFLKSAADNEQIMGALKKFSELQAGAMTQATVATPTTGIVIPGNERLIIPANPQVILPKEQTETIILPAFDESIPFDLRMNRILEEKKRREQNGEFFHEMVEEVIRCILEGDWVYLWGPSGCGKSFVIKQVAELIGIDLVENGKITDKYSIMAYNDPHGHFRATQAFVALVYGKMLSLDEFDNGNTDTQVVLNELYSGLLDVLGNPNKKRYVTFAEDMTVPISPNFRMISAGNTKGGGENQIFSSRGKIDEAVQERMTPKEFRYDNLVEQKIFGQYTNWYEIFIKFREACDLYAKQHGLDTAPGIGTTRDAAAIVKYINHNSKSIDQIMREKFTQTKERDYLSFLKKKFSEFYSLDETDTKNFDIPESLRDADTMVLAKSFIKACNNSLNGVSEKRKRR